MDLYSPVLCALVYCSPQFNKGFILDLLSGVKFLGILTSMFAAPQNSCDLSDIISNNSHRPSRISPLIQILTRHTVSRVSSYLKTVAAVRTRIPPAYDPPVPLFSITLSPFLWALWLK